MLAAAEPGCRRRRPTTPPSALGLAIGAGALAARDKLTLIVPPALRGVRAVGRAADRRKHREERQGRRADCRRAARPIRPRTARTASSSACGRATELVRPTADARRRRRATLKTLGAGRRDRCRRSRPRSAPNSCGGKSRRRSPARSSASIRSTSRTSSRRRTRRRRCSSVHRPLGACRSPPPDVATPDGTSR